jgi:hypothetical protein
VLSQLSSLVPPTGSASADPLPSPEQSVVDQTSCQQEEGGTTTTQTQTAVQTSATVQIVASLPELLQHAPAAGTLDQSQQDTWELQIGCLFYCVGSQQVQQAAQSTTIVIVGAPPGSTVTVVQQTVWQLQIGCVAWCWDSTQIQRASQSTISMVTSPTAGDDRPPQPAAGPAPAPAAPPSGPLSVSSSPQEPAPAGGSPISSGGTVASFPHPSATRTILLAASSRGVGLAILRSWPVGPASASASRPGTHRTAAVVEVAETIVGGATAPVMDGSPPQRGHRPPRHAPAPVLAPASVRPPSSGGGTPIVALLLAAAGAVFIAALRREARR